MIVWPDIYCFVSWTFLFITQCRPPSEPLKAFILDEEPLEPLKCLFGPLSDFIFTFEPLFAAFCPQNVHNLGFGVNFCSVQVFYCPRRAVRDKSYCCQPSVIYRSLSNAPRHHI